MISIDLIKSRETRQIEMTIEEYHSLVSSFKVDLSKLTAPIRFYVDVDGVLLPFIRNEEDLSKFNSVIKTSVLDSDWKGSFIEVFHYYAYHKQVVDRLAQISKHPMIDFVFLTSWNFNAVRSIAKAFSIETAGFLPWALKMSDYNQVFKGVAIRELEEKSPSRFVWIDDVANKKYPERSHYFSRYDDLHYDDEANEFKKISYEEYLSLNKQLFLEDDGEEFYEIPESSYLTVTTNSYSGLKMIELDRIESWVKGNLEELGKD